VLSQNVLQQKGSPLTGSQTAAAHAASPHPAVARLVQQSFGPTVQTVGQKSASASAQMSSQSVVQQTSFKGKAQTIASHAALLQPAEPLNGTQQSHVPVAVPCPHATPQKTPNTTHQAVHSRIIKPSPQPAALKPNALKPAALKPNALKPAALKPADSTQLAPYWPTITTPQTEQARHRPTQRR